MVASISGAASAWRPRSDASIIAVNGAARLPVTSQIASASAIRAAAAAKSPLHATAVPSAPSMTGSWSSAPAVTGEPDLPDEHRAPGVVVPQGAGGRLGQPAPAEVVLRA